MPLPLFFKSFIPTHTRRLKNGKVVTVQAYSDKRLRKDAIPVHVDHEGIKAEDKGQWARLHKEQHVLHHTDKALHERRIKEAAEAVEHHNKKAAHHEAQRDLARKNGDSAALSGHNKALTHHHNRAAAWGVKRGNHERHLAKVDSKLEGIKALKEKLWAGSGEVASTGNVGSPEALVQIALSRKDGNKAFATLGKVNTAVAEKVKAATGIDVNGYVHSIDEAAVRHIINNHGDEKTEKQRGQIAVTPDDLKNIKAITENPDSVTEGETYNEAKTVVYKKTIGDTTIYVQEVKEGRKRLAAKTLWKTHAAPPALANKATVVPTSETLNALSSPQDNKSITEPAKKASGQPLGYNNYGKIEFTFHQSKETQYNAYAFKPEVKSKFNPDAKILASKIISVNTKFNRGDYPELPKHGTKAWRISAVATKKDGTGVYVMAEYADGNRMTSSGRLEVDFVKPDGHYVDGMEWRHPAIYKEMMKMFDTFSDNKSVFDDNKSGSAKITPTGKTNEVKTAQGTKINTQFAVVEASDLTTSHDANGNANPNYPKELQPRNRGRDTSQAQIARIAKNLDPDMLGRTRNASNGAPIVGNDGVVESGNGRTLAINQAYQTGKADDYRDWLEDIADTYGLDAKHIKGMKNPVLVRVRTSGIDRAQFAREANQSDMLAMTATEKAKADANHLTDAVIGRLQADGDLTSSSNRDFIMSFMGKLGDDESAGLSTTDGKPTKQLYDRAQAAIFSKAYNDDRLLELMADEAKPDIANIIKSLNQAAPSFIKARGLSEHHTQATTGKLTDAVGVSLDKQAVDAIVKATEALKKAKDSNMPIEKLIAQGDMFGGIDPVVAQMALFIKDNNRSASRMGEAFTAMADYLVTELTGRQNESLFGDETPISLVDVLKAANAQLQKHYGENVKAIGNGKTGGFIDIFTETRGQKADREAFLKKSSHHANPLLLFFTKAA